MAILDADKEGFLRSHVSLIQTIGRAARNLNGRVIMYADEHHRLDAGWRSRRPSRRREVQRSLQRRARHHPAVGQEATSLDLSAAALRRGPHGAAPGRRRGQRRARAQGDQAAHRGVRPRTCSTSRTRWSSRRPRRMRDRVLLLKDMDLGLKPPSRALLQAAARRRTTARPRQAGRPGQGRRGGAAKGARARRSLTRWTTRASSRRSSTTLPTEPGVYLMKDRRGEVIYVGKAVNLRNRVRSYFNRTGDTRAFVAAARHAARRHRDGARPQREGGAAPRERAHQEAQAALQRPAQGRQELHLPAARPRRRPIRGSRWCGAIKQGRGALLRPLLERERHPRDAAHHQPLLPAAHLHGPRARQPQAALPAAPDRPLPRALRLPGARARSTASSVDEVVLFLEGKARRAGGRAASAHEAGRERAQVRGGRAHPRSAARHRAQPRAPEGGHHRLHGPGRLRASTARRTGCSSTSSTCARAGSTAARPSPSAARSSPTRSCSPSFVNLYYDQGNFVPEEVLLPLEPEEHGGPRGAAHRAQGRAGAACWCPSAARSASWWRWRQKNAEQAFLERRRTKDETEDVLERLQDRLAPAPSCRAASSASTSRTSRARASSRRRWRSPTARSTRRATAASGSRRSQQQDDFASMHEVITRRLKRGPARRRTCRTCIVIDGGKGQLRQRATPR